ncbi:MAG: hypothetical protein M0Q87_12210 [Ottowia sp.]|nr:hypothetical protein [Ottowia sp.]
MCPPRSTLNLFKRSTTLIAAQPRSLPPRSGAVIRSASEVIRHAPRQTLDALRSTSSNAQPPLIAAQPRSLPPRSGAVIRSASEVIRHAPRQTLDALRSTSSNAQPLQTLNLPIMAAQPQS